jgi:hypothetical protein
METPQGAVNHKHLDYLDEVAFRINRRTSRSLASCFIVRHNNLGPSIQLLAIKSLTPPKKNRSKSTAAAGF